MKQIFMVSGPIVVDFEAGTIELSASLTDPNPPSVPPTQPPVVVPPPVVVVPPSAGADQIDIAQITFINAPDASDWNKTATVTSLSFEGGITRIDFTKKNGPGRWPDVVPAGWEGPLQYTLWLVKSINGAWVASAFIQFWNTRDGSGDAGDPDVPSLYDKNWYYSSRWSPIYGSGPIQPGEQIGFFVTSGNQRDSVGPDSVQERSNIVVIPATDHGTFTW